MATQPDQFAEADQKVELEPGAPASEEPQQQAEPAGEGEGEGEPPKPSEVEELARSMGWRPQDQFKGDPNLWKPATDYIRAGAEIQRSTSRDLKEMRATMENMTRTQAAIVEKTISDERDKLVEKYNQTVTDGDAAGAYRIGQEIHTLNGRAAALAQPPPQEFAPPPPEAQSWVERNPWFNQDPLARDLALAVAERYASAGKSNPEQLLAAEREVRKQYPHLFAGASTKPAPGVHAPGGRGGSGGRKGSTYADLPDAAKKVATDMADRGVIPNVEAYAKQYWQNEAKGS